MDLTSRFSLEDFLAYFFPGAVALMGLLALPLSSWVSVASVSDTGVDPLGGLEAGIVVSLGFVVISYTLGVVLSSISEWLSRLEFPKWMQKYTLFRRTHPKDAIPLKSMTSRVLDAYSVTFGLELGDNYCWTKDDFYVCRSLVVSSMPRAVPVIQRQSGLRQLRMSLLPVIWIWCAIVCFWPPAEGSRPWWWIGVIVLVGFTLTMVTRNRMKANERREVREVLTALVAGSATGTFDPEGKSDND